MKALLIVDIQNDFLPGGALPVEGGDLIIPRINALQEEFERVIATKDWHPPQHISFASTHGKEVGTKLALPNGEQQLWPDHCIQNTSGAAFPETLRQEKIEAVFYKGSDPFIDSYSAFYDNAHQRSTGLAEYLKEQGIDQLYIAGLTTDYCVKYSALDAIKEGFSVKIVCNACKGIDLYPQDVEKAIEEMRRAGAVILLK